MEISIKYVQYKLLQLFCITILFCVSFSINTYGQQLIKSYTIKNGKMHIKLSKNLSDVSVDSFINKHEFYELDLKTFLKTNNTDSILKLGWAIEENSRELLIMSKPFVVFEKLKNPTESIVISGTKLKNNTFINNAKYGFNLFKNKKDFEINDSMVTFFLKDGKTLTTVFVAGTFNNWKNNDIALTKTDSGWYTKIKIAPGKHLYKFIIDGNWWTDIDNTLKENDGEGNINSIYYFTNTKFVLNGFSKAKKVILSGSFNNWNERELKMLKTKNGWELPLYLANGTYTYRFIVDKKWIIDSSNVNKVPNEFDEFNSIISIGKAEKIKLSGFTNAKKVILTGSFNNWKEHELQMKKTAEGWEYDYVLGNGNFEYRFIVDGKKIGDTNALEAKEIKNFSLTLNPNYNFKIKGLENAKKIFLAGDFNNWSTHGFEMKRVDGAWELPVHLITGKHLYKIIVDGVWMIDPTNNLFEQNEYDTGNSIIWF